MEQEKSFTVEDDKGHRFLLRGKRWEGGQGVVTVDSTGQFIIKIIKFDKQEGDAIREKVRQQLKRVRVMPLENLPVASPIAMLMHPYVGYVMKYLRGMDVLEKLINPPQGVINEEISPVEWYNQTGGLKRRLLLLARLASVLKHLHSKGIVYGDLSPKNVLISESVDHNEVFLIDLDNLCYESSSLESFIRTENFCAPEVFNHKHGIDSWTDAYTFAILAFWVLTLKHPFEGEYVENGDPGEMSRQINSGELPWIFHSTNDLNRSNHVLPKELFISKGLLNLFQKTFEAGLHNRRERPTITAWETSLYAAARFVLKCPNCKWSYYHDQRICPCCEVSRPAYLLVTVEDLALDWHKTLKVIRKVTGWCLQYPGKFTFTRRILGFNDEEADQPILEVQIDEKLRTFARMISNREAWLVHEAWKLEAGVSSDHPKFKLGDTWTPFSLLAYSLHIGQLEQTHQAIRFERK